MTLTFQCPTNVKQNWLVVGRRSESQLYLLLIILWLVTILLHLITYIMIKI